MTPVTGCRRLPAAVDMVSRWSRDRQRLNRINGTPLAMRSSISRNIQADYPTRGQLKLVWSPLKKNDGSIACMQSLSGSQYEGLAMLQRLNSTYIYELTADVFATLNHIAKASPATKAARLAQRGGPSGATPAGEDGEEQVSMQLKGSVHTRL